MPRVDTNRVAKCGGRSLGACAGVQHALDLLDDQPGWITVEDPGPTFEDLGQRPVAALLSVWQAASPHDQRLRPGDPVLVDQPALADPGFPVDGDQMRSFLHGDPLEKGVDQRELVPAAHHRRVEKRSCDVSGRAQQLMDHHRTFPSPQCHRAEVAEPEPAAGPHRPVGYQDLTGLGVLLETGGHVDRVSRHDSHLGTGP